MLINVICRTQLHKRKNYTYINRKNNPFNLKLFYKYKIESVHIQLQIYLFRYQLEKKIVHDT